MNPASASVPAPRMVNDVSGPAPAPAAPIAVTTNLVASIPVHNQATQAAPATEDDELDKIMQDVGREMSKDDKKPPKHGLLHFGHNSKATPKPLAPIATAVQPAPAEPMATPQTVSLPSPQPPIAAVQPQTQAAPVATAKAKKQSSTPVFAIFVAILVTGFLVAAAIAAYRQS